jgi:hypothetical protein
MLLYVPSLSSYNLPLAALPVPEAHVHLSLKLIGLQFNANRKEEHWGPDAKIFDPDRWLDEVRPISILSPCDVRSLMCFLALWTFFPASQTSNR